MRGLNFAKFKKTSQDAKTATLMHPDGHEIRIAISSLQPEMRQQLTNLPIYMAEGGEAEKPDEKEEDDDSDDVDLGPEEEEDSDTDLVAPVPEAAAPELPAAGAPGTVPGVQPPSPSAGLAGAPLAAAPAEAPLPTAAIPIDERAPAEEQAPETQAQAQQVAAPVQAPPRLSQTLKEQDMAFQHDLDMGHIQPKTMTDLFANKSTLGKIGTLFGLMISGAGAGLSKQPNALLQMMQKEIDNDLEAQKNSHANAQNLYRLNLEHQRNEMAMKQAQVGIEQTKAQTGRIGVENQLTSAQIQKLGREGELTDSQKQHLLAENKLMGLETNIKADAFTRMQANRVILNSLTQKVNAMPVGSAERQKAEQQLALLNNSVQNENFSIADRAEAASALGSLAYGGGEQKGENPEANFQKQQAALRMSGNAGLADERAQRHFPGIPGLASVPLSGEDRNKINAGITFKNQLDRFYNWAEQHSGDLNPTERAFGQTLARDLQGAYRQASDGGVYKEGEQHYISSIIDSTPTKFFNDIRVLPKLQAVKSEHTAKLNQILKSKGFQTGYASNSAPAKRPSVSKSSGGVSEGQSMKLPDGKEFVFQNGKWNQK